MSSMKLLRLKELMSEKKVSGKELAEKVNVSANTISSISNGNTFPKPELLASIADALDVDIKELFYSTKDSKRQTIYVKSGDSYKAIGEINK